ncbi:MAG: hypothetical protein ABJ214_20335 [Roseobacter sp.]
MFKFMHSKWLEPFITGKSVKIGSIREYRGFDATSDVDTLKRLFPNVFGDDDGKYSWETTVGEKS